MSAIVIGFRRFSHSPTFRSISLQYKNNISKSQAVLNSKKFVNLTNISLLGCGGFLLYNLFDNSADCMSSKDNNSGNNSFPNDPYGIFNKYFQQYSEQINQLGFSGIAGVFSGYAFKRISKEIAFAIGGVFIFLQGLSYLGYININYKKLESDVTEKLDQNGDGKLDMEDARVAWNNANSVLSVGLPSVSGFSSGFAMGFYFG